MEARIAATDGEIAETDEEFAELRKEQAELDEAASSLESKIVEFEHKAKALLKQVPAPLRELVKPLSRNLPEKPEDTEQKLPSRFLNVCGIFSTMHKFNQEIKVEPELMDLPDGTSAQVTVLYIGIGQGYYVNGDASVAGYGRSTADGWAWQPANEYADEIAKAIAIARAEEVAAFVQLPIRIE